MTTLKQIARELFEVAFFAVLAAFTLTLWTLFVRFMIWVITGGNV